MNTKALRQKILDLAIHGKLVPQDPNDEPASVLLERIRAEKERLIKEGKIKKPKKSKATCDKPHYPFELPEGWVWCKLVDCCHIAGRIGFRGYTKDDLVEDGAITLSPSNIVDGIMNFEKCTYISWDKYNESPEIMVQCGDILLVKTGSSYGKCAFVGELPKKATINPQFVVLKYTQIDAKYLTYVLQSSYARHCYDDFVLGTAIPTFTQAVLGNMYIPLPSIVEQKRIVDRIRDWAAFIEQLESGKLKLQDSIKQAKSKILDLAIHGKLVPQDPNDEPACELLKRINPKAEIICDNPPYGKLPKGWCLCKISSVVDIVNGKSQKNVESPTGKYPIYGSGGIIGKATEYTCLAGSTIIGRKGTINHPIFVEEYFWNVDTAFGMKANNQILEDKYFYFFCLSFDFSKLDKSSALPSLTKTAIENQILPIPSLAEQHRIVAKIEELFTLLDKIESSL